MKDFLVFVIVIIALVSVLMFTFSLKIHAATNSDYVGVNQTECLKVDSLDRLYDGKGDCYIRLTEDNIQDFCAIGKGQDQQWCDQDIMTELLRDRINHK